MKDKTKRNLSIIAVVGGAGWWFLGLPLVAAGIAAGVIYIPPVYKKIKDMD